MTSLDPNFERPAYRYGRLFNVLERIQENATGGGGVERTFGSAMTSPVSTLPRLIGRAKQAHLPKLKRDKPGLYYWFQETLTEILEKPEPLGGFKTRLEPEEQGLFVLGYYHQRAHRKSDEEAKTEMTETSINNSNSKE